MVDRNLEGRSELCPCWCWAAVWSAGESAVGST